MEITPELALKLQPQYELIEDRLTKGATIHFSFWTYLQQSEQQLIDQMNNNPPGPDAPGSIEVSWALYYLNYKIPPKLTKFLRDWTGMPQSQITAADWTTWATTLNGQGVVMGDGSLVNYCKYAVLDVFWATAFLNYLLLYLGETVKHSFGTTPATLSVTGKTQLNVALFGDWGTGPYTDGNLSASPSQLIKAAINKQAPDISIHLGDVYYGGTPTEEQNQLVACWPTALTGNFTMNSNHEMYVGANGLFGVLATDIVFKGQQNTTYFQIEFGNWLIIGLDTAYYDNSFLFMDGALTDPAQTAFLKAAGKTGKQICILTHHNPLDTTGQNQTGLWAQVVNALGKSPDYWYWGHVHNGMVYTAASAGGAVNCRCLGNAAIPIGNASWLANSPTTVSYYTNKVLANPTVQQQLRVLNGYAILTFTTTGVTETWYYQDGTQAWQS